jgi:hypothetical protein
MKQTIVLCSFIFMLFCSFVTPPKKLCGPSFRIYNNHTSINITGYQIWETGGNGSAAASVTITPGNNYLVAALPNTGSFAVRIFLSAPSTGSTYAWNDIPGEWGCADLVSGATRSTVMLDVSSCDEIVVQLRTQSCY